jgi:hypothetical protein
MQITIGLYDPDTRTVPVHFEHDGVEHERSVNACHDEDGEYDDEATTERVGQVARGVEAKIAVGAIRTPDPVDAPEPTEEAEPAQD